MGYYTSFNLSVIENSSTLTEIDLIAAFREFSYGAEYALSEEGTCRESCKWYTAEDDLVLFSESYPDVLFLLEGDGEEQGDLWKCYAKGGKRCTIQGQIVFAEFKEDMLS